MDSLNINLDLDENLEDNNDEELDALHKILNILSEKNIKNLPPDFFLNLNLVVEKYYESGKINFLFNIIKEMNDDELIAFIFNNGERRNRPKLFVIKDVEIDIYGSYFRNMVDYITERSPEVLNDISKPEIDYVIRQLFTNALEKFFDKERLYLEFLHSYKTIISNKSEILK